MPWGSSKGIYESVQRKNFLQWGVQHKEKHARSEHTSQGCDFCLNPSNFHSKSKSLLGEPRFPATIFFLSFVSASGAAPAKYVIEGFHPLHSPHPSAGLSFCHLQESIAFSTV